MNGPYSASRAPITPLPCPPHTSLPVSGEPFRPRGCKPMRMTDDSIVGIIRVYSPLRLHAVVQKTCSSHSQPFLSTLFQPSSDFIYSRPFPESPGPSFLFPLLKFTKCTKLEHRAPWNIWFVSVLLSPSRSVVCPPHLLHSPSAPGTFDFGCTPFPPVLFFFPAPLFSCSELLRKS